MIIAEKKIVLTFSILICLALFLVSCEQNSDDPVIETGTIDGQEYFVPRVYSVMPEHPFEKDQSIYVRALWPEFSPIIWDQDLRKKGRYYQKIRIIIRRMQKNDLSILLNRPLKYAPNYVGQEYGLRKQIKLLNEKNAKPIWDQKDLRLEEKAGEIVSFIECKRTDGVYKEENKFARCDHHFFIGLFWFKISYDKKMLPHWNDIKEKSIALYESFKSRETAIAFYRAAQDAHRNRIETSSP